MTNIHTIRPSDSKLVAQITKSVSSGSGADIILPDGRWDLLFLNQDGIRTAYLFSMPSVQAQTVPYLADQESLVITFETGSFIDSSIFLDKKGMYELEMQGGNRFRLGSMTFEIPTLENADTFVTALEAKGLLKSDFAVQSEALGTLRAQADRTLQRHFRHVTGMTPNQYKQIIRALRAAEMLKAGTPAIVVAYDLGFTDQFHMSKSLKQILGQTPSEISKHT